MPMDSAWDTACAVGFPIRKFTDQSLLAAPRDLSQRATSFIASQCQGIHQMPFRRLISTPTKTLAPRAGTSLLASRPTGPAVSAVRCYSQPASPCGLAGRGASSVTCTSSSLVHDPASARVERGTKASAARSLWSTFPCCGSFQRSSKLSGSASLDTSSPFRKLVEADGIEPTTSCLQSRRSPN